MQPHQSIGPAGGFPTGPSAQRARGATSGLPSSNPQQQYQAFYHSQKPWLPSTVPRAAGFVSGPTVDGSHSFSGRSTGAPQALPPSARGAPTRPAPVPSLGAWGAAPMQDRAFVPSFAAQPGGSGGTGGWNMMQWGSSRSPAPQSQPGPATIAMGDVTDKLQTQPTPPPSLAPGRSATATSLSNDQWSPRPTSPEAPPVSHPEHDVVSPTLSEEGRVSISEDEAMVSPSVFDEESDLSTDAESESDSDDEDSESSSEDEEHKRSAHLAALAADTRQMYGRASGRRAAVDRPWTDEECVQLAVLVQEEGEGSWTMIARKIGSRRTAAACEAQYKLLTCPSPTAASADKMKHRKKKEDEDTPNESGLSATERAALYRPPQVVSGSVEPMIKVQGPREGGIMKRFPKRMLANFKVGQLPKERVIQTWNVAAQECFWKLRVEYWNRQKVRKCKKSCPERGLRPDGDVWAVRRRLCMSEFKRSGIPVEEILDESSLRFWADSASESEAEESEEESDSEDEKEGSDAGEMAASRAPLLDADVGQCEKSPFCTRGFHHRGNGGQCNGQRAAAGGMPQREDMAKAARGKNRRAEEQKLFYSSTLADGDDDNDGGAADASSFIPSPVRQGPSPWADASTGGGQAAAEEPQLLEQPQQTAAAAAANPALIRDKGRCSKHSVYRGLCWRKNSNKWQVEIRNRYLGRYADEIKAAQAYDKEALRVFGVTAKLNFPGEHTPAGAASFERSSSEIEDSAAGTENAIDGQDQPVAKRKRVWDKETRKWIYSMSVPAAASAPVGRFGSRGLTPAPKARKTPKVVAGLRVEYAFHTDGANRSSDLRHFWAKEDGTGGTIKDATEDVATAAKKPKTWSTGTVLKPGRWPTWHVVDFDDGGAANIQLTKLAYGNGLWHTQDKIGLPRGRDGLYGASCGSGSESDAEPASKRPKQHTSSFAKSGASNLTDPHRCAKHFPKAVRESNPWGSAESERLVDVVGAVCAEQGLSSIPNDTAWILVAHRLGTSRGSEACRLRYRRMVARLNKGKTVADAPHPDIPVSVHRVRGKVDPDKPMTMESERARSLAHFSTSRSSGAAAGEDQDDGRRRSGRAVRQVENPDFIDISLPFLSFGHGPKGHSQKPFRPEKDKEKKEAEQEEAALHTERTAKEERRKERRKEQRKERARAAASAAASGGASGVSGRVKRKTEPKRRQPTPRVLAVRVKHASSRQGAVGTDTDKDNRRNALKSPAAMGRNGNDVRKGDRVQVKFTNSSHIGTVIKIGLGYGKFVAEFARTYAKDESHTIDPKLHEFNILRVIRTNSGQAEGKKRKGGEGGGGAARRTPQPGAGGGKRGGGAAAAASASGAQGVDDMVKQKLACAICLGTPEDAAKCETPCGHFFCNGCITQWLRMHGSGRQCPVCREDLSALSRELSTALRRPEDKQKQTGGGDADNGGDGDAAGVDGEGASRSKSA